MTPDEKKAEEVFQDKFFNVDGTLKICVLFASTKEFFVEFKNLVVEALTEAHKQEARKWKNAHKKWESEYGKLSDQLIKLESEAKQKDERIARLEAQITLLNQQIESWQRSSTGWCEKHDAVKATNAELEKRVKELELELNDIQRKYATEPGRLNQDYAINNKDKQIASLTARLSEALGALNYIYQNCDSEQERWAKETAKAIINNPDNSRLLEREKALEETKKLYDEAMSICCEHFDFVKFGSVKDCLASVVEEMKGLRAVVEAVRKLELHKGKLHSDSLCEYTNDPEKGTCDLCKAESDVVIALEAHEKEGGV